jgi:hypothetical protein
MTQYAFIDGVAGLGALLSVACFWESLRHGGKWIAGFCAGYLLLLLTKQETAVFTAFFFAGILACSRPLGFGRAGLKLPVAFVLTPVAAVLILALHAGGLGTLFEVFRINALLQTTLPYTLATGGGPWYRYLVEHLFVNPVVFLLAAGFAIHGASQTALSRYLLLFFLVTFVIMGSLPHGMNIRHTVMWDFPVAIFAVQCLDRMTGGMRRQRMIMTVMVAFVCLIELRQYDTIFVKLYDTDPKFMFQNVELIQ